MKMAIGGTLMTIGCLMLLCAVLAIVLSSAPFEDVALAGGGGLPTLIAAALVGWAGLTILLGCLLLRRVPRSSIGQVPVLVAAILGTLAGTGVYFLYELPFHPAKRSDPYDDVTFHVRGFGTTLPHRGNRVEWTTSEGRLRTTSPKGLLLAAGIGTLYAFVSGAFPSGLIAWFLRGKSPADVADYGEKMPPILPAPPPVDPPKDS